MDKIIVRKTCIKQFEDNASATSHRLDNVQNHTVKLPKLVSETLLEDISQWKTLWSQYDTEIEKNPNLSKSDKFTHLKSFLTGRLQM